MANPTIDAILAGRSIRRFRPDPIEPEAVDLILRAATRAATAGRLQPHSLVVVEDRDVLADSPFREAPAVIVALVDFYRIKRQLELNRAPFYWNQASDLFLSFRDATIALQNAVIAAESLGPGVLYIGGVLSEDMIEFLGAPEHTFPAGLVLLGPSDKDSALRLRLPMDAVIHRNAHRRPSDDEIRTWGTARRICCSSGNPTNRGRDLARKGFTTERSTSRLGTTPRRSPLGRVQESLPI